MEKVYGKLIFNDGNNISMREGEISFGNEIFVKVESNGKVEWINSRSVIRIEKL